MSFRMSPVIAIMRPSQWVKNGFVFLSLFFGGELFNLYCWLPALVAFIAFCFASSAVYCFNDILDIDDDRLHPSKCQRPLASGAISIRQAYCLMIVLVIASFLTCSLVWILGKALDLALIVAAYLILNVAYCLKLKHFAIIDVFVVAFGFVLRLLAGGVVCDIWLSPWIIVMTFLVALFLAFAKRRDDVVFRETTGMITRRNTIRYNLSFLNQVLGLIGAMTTVCYIIWSVSPEVQARLGSGYLYITTIFVLAGILRYLQVAIVDSRSGSPTIIVLHDRFIQGCIALWILSFIAILYL